MSIPAQIHFCWIGTSLPWASVFAILSAAERSDLPDIILHHADDLDDGPQLRALLQAPCVRLSRIDPLACLAQTEATLGLSGGALTGLYNSLTSPVMRTDILRAAILHQRGGIYLDLDTVTVASLAPLLRATQFVGSEFIVWPLFARASRSPAKLARYVTLDVLRKLLKRLPNGWRVFRRVERLYFRGINNAVMGAQASSRLFSSYLSAMLDVPAKRQMQAYALGPDLLQDVVDQYRHDDLVIHEPHVFYPLPPEISEHWFRLRRDVRLAEVLSAETRVAHWYASIRNRSRINQIDPAYVRAHRHHQLYSTLVHSCIRDFEQLV